MSLKKAFRAFLKGEVAQAELDSFRYTNGQLDELELAIKAVAEDLKPNHRVAAAYTWVARALMTIGHCLMEADESADPSTAGYLPKVTFNQAKVLFEQAPDYIHAAHEAMANPDYQPSLALPVELGPRCEAEGKCPNSHLQGILLSATNLDVHLTDLLAISAFSKLDNNTSQLKARASSKLGFASSQLSMLVVRNAPEAVHEDTENRLWDALSDLYMLGQVVCMPKATAVATQKIIAKLSQPTRQLDELEPDPIKTYVVDRIIPNIPTVGRLIQEDVKWCFTEREAMRDLRGTKLGEAEMKEFWARKGWRTTKRQDEFFDTCAQLQKTGAISIVTRWSKCPFDPIFQTHTEVTVLGTRIARGTEFHLDMDEDKDEIKLGSPRFRRTKGYEEAHEDGHITDPGAH